MYPDIPWDIRTILEQQNAAITRMQSEIEGLKQFVSERNSIGIEAPTALVRVIHAVPDAPAVDVWVDGRKTIVKVSYRTGSRYLPLPIGDHQVRVVPHNRTTPVLIDAMVQLEAGTAYTVLAIGSVQSIRPMITIDSLRSMASDLADIRILHASPDAPSIDVYLPDGRKVVSSLMFGQVTSPLEVALGPFSANIRIAGTNQTVYTIPITMLRAGISYTCLVTGLAIGTPGIGVLIIPNLP